MKSCATQRSRAFQSTRPLRGATKKKSLKPNPKVFQSTRPLRGATGSTAMLCADISISIHAPLAGRDCTIKYHGNEYGVFQSTRPLRGATAQQRSLETRDRISIHAPLAGRDSKNAQNYNALLRKRYNYKRFVCKKCTSGILTAVRCSKNSLFFGANHPENPCALSVRTQRISGPSTSNPGLMPKCSILERYFSPR